MQDSILTVRELTEQLRKNLEVRFPFVWVRGEVSNCSRPVSGHVYFSLKDQDAQLQCVWFKGRQQASQGQRFDPLTGEVFEQDRPSPVDLLRNGAELLCAGRISVYAPRGQYQLTVDLVQAGGLGLLAQAFEERKQQLAALGYFAQERKRPLPPDPARVALITSPSGAALHDFWELAQSRGSGAAVRLFPVRVQGEGAAAEIARAIAEANAQGWAQVLVLIRGGGSLEDLWAFNEAEVAEAVFRSAVPVLAGIGHEMDVSLADMTADVRAATPSHAAHLLWPGRDQLRQRLDEASEALCRAAAQHLEQAARLLREQEQALRWCSPQRHQARLTEQLARWQLALPRAVGQWLDQKRHALDRQEQARRAALSPQSLDLRAAHLAGLTKALQQASGQALAESGRALAAWNARLQQGGRRWLEARERALEACIPALEARDPLAPLERGYALVRVLTTAEGPLQQTGRGRTAAHEGRLLRSVHQAEPGAHIEVRLRDGRVAAMVREVVPDETQVQKGEGHDA